MRNSRAFGTVAAAAIIAALLSAGCQRGEPVASVEAHWDLLGRYCTDCHNAAEYTGDLSLQGLTPEHIHASPQTWEKVILKLRGDLMPPPGNAKPEQARIDAFIAALETFIDRDVEVPRAGHVPIQRLTRTEYALAVQELVGVEIRPEEYLPTEIEVDGFTNIAAALSVSPSFLEQYVAVARTVARMAVGSPQPKLASAWFPPPGGDQSDYIDGLPLGTRGGMKFEHRFPADGQYRITLTDLDVGLYPRSLETEHTLVILIDRVEVFRGHLGGAADLALVDRGGAPARAEIMERFTNISVHVQAGVREVAVTFLERSRAATDEIIAGFTPYGGFNYTGALRVPRIIGGIEVVGPFEPAGISRTASREKIFVCEPRQADEERACAARIATELAGRAFRRPVDRADVERLMPFYEAGHAMPGGFDAGVEQLVAAVLASPDFLYRAISPPPAGLGDVDIYPLTDFELASRLSFFLWSRGPDDELLELAAAGALQNPDVLEAQASRMLADARADALVKGFALRWLNLDQLDSVVPDERLYPAFSDQLRRDFAAEIELFVRSVLLEDRDVRELLTGDRTYLNENLARHYGIDGVHGPQFRPVTLADETRHGLLGKGATLLRTSYGDRTSPVLRGAWVLEKLKGTPPAPPPPDVETDLNTPEGEEVKTIRARLEQHREDPGCNGCHGVIDPYGLALENFTAIGAWREVDRDADAAIDASTTLPSGVAVEGPVELRRALLRRPDQLVQALTEKLMMYALGRELEYHDMPQVRAIVRAAARQDYRLSAIVAGIVRSDAFRHQAPPHHAEPARVQADARTASVPVQESRR